MRVVFWAAMWLWLSLQALVGWRALGTPGGITTSTVLRVFFTIGIGALILAMALLARTPLPGTGGWWWGTRRRGQRFSPCPIGLVLVLPGAAIIFLMTAETLLSRWFGKQIAFLPQDIPQAIIYALILLMIGGGARLLLHAGTVNQHRWRQQRRKWFIPWSITATILSAAATSYGMFVNADSGTVAVLSTFMFLPLLLLAIAAHFGARRLRERVRECE